MIMFKSEVKLDFSSVAITHMLFNLSHVSNQLGVDFVITSGNDGHGLHMRGSKHYINQAIDVRSKSFGPEMKHKIWESMKVRMGPKFFVDLEHEGKDNEHFHIQVRKNITFP